MTQEQQNSSNLPAIINDELDIRARATLLPTVYDSVVVYLSSGKPEISSVTCQKFFELFITGDSIEEIHRLNPSFPVEAIHWARVKYEWDNLKNQYMAGLHTKVMDKVYKAQLETTGLYADILSAAQRKFGDKIRKYLQTGDEKDLGDGLQVDSIHQLIKVGEALQKITGQDRNINIKKDQSYSLNINNNTANLAAKPLPGKVLDAEVVGDLDDESASKILEILADSKRKTD